MMEFVLWKEGAVWSDVSVAMVEETLWGELVPW